jgi:hypothetical protein
VAFLLYFAAFGFLLSDGVSTRFVHSRFNEKEGGIVVIIVDCIVAICTDLKHITQSTQ